MLTKKIGTTLLILPLLFLGACGSAAISTPSADAPLPTAVEAPPTETPAEPGSTGEAWFKTYGGVSGDAGWDLLVAEDGGYYIAGTTNLQFEPVPRGDVYLIRTDPAGDVLWEKSYGGENYEEGSAIFATADGGLALSGYTRSSDAQGMDIFTIRIDADGQELGSSTFGGPLDEMGGAWPLEDGGFLLGGIIVDPNDFVADPGAAGYGGLAGRSNIYLARVDPDGNELWSRSFGGADNVLGAAGIQAPDGGFFILATVMYYPQDDNDMLLLRVDQDGQELWSRRWDEGDTTGYDLIATADGNYLISASYGPLDEGASSEPDSLFIKVDPQGEEIWRSLFGEPDMIDYGALLVEAADGSGYFAAGEWGRDLHSHSSDISWVKIGPDGELLWRQILPTSTHNMFGALRPDPAGGYLLTGSTVTARGDFDIFVLKTDPQGNLPQ